MLSVRKAGGEGIHTHEQIVGVWIRTTDSEQLHQIMELAMDVSAHCYWTFLHSPLALAISHRRRASYHRLHIRFVLQDLSCLNDALLDSSLSKTSPVSPIDPVEMREACIPSRRVSAHLPLPIACRSSNSRSTHRG